MPRLRLAFGAARIPAAVIGNSRRIILNSTAFANRVNQKIAAKNRLAGPEGVSQTGPPLDKSPKIPWPREFKHAYAISMLNRPERAAGLKARLSHWRKHVQVWPATNGYLINKTQWARQGKTRPGCGLNRGQLGCYDSHVRIWRHIVDRKIPTALILEDDANLRYRKDVSKRLHNALAEVREKFKHQWDLLYIGVGNPRDCRKIGRCLGRYWGCQGLFAYAVTLHGAKVLLHRSSPYSLPVDVFVSKLIDQRVLKAYGIRPRVCHVVPVRSDTTFIH